MSSALDDILGNKPTPLPQQQPQPTQQPTGAKPLVDWNKAGAEYESSKPKFTPDILQQQEKEKAEANKIVPPLAPPVEHGNTGEQMSLPADKKKRLSYVEMYKKLNPYQPPTQEELEKERKKEKREKMFAAIGDTISALSNLYFTTQYAPNMYKHENSQSDKVKSKWDKLREDRDAQMNAYIKNLMAAQQADDENAENERKWQRQLDIDDYNKRKDADESQYKKDRDKVKDEQWQKSYDQKAEQFETNKGIKKDAQKEAERSHRANEGLKGAQIQEAKRHNSVTEAQGAERIAISRAKGVSSSGSGKGGKGSKQETIRLHDGSVHTYSPDKKGALTSLAPSMAKKARAAAERYRKAGDRRSYSHYIQIANALEKTKNKDAIAAIVVSNVGDFPTMDGDVRRVIGATGSFNVSNYRRKGNSKSSKSTSKPPLN
ncbi:hypothetical protein [Prevotella amnii]|uniref:Uncharacterized protein n=1 Tax=Prevotella amnii DNF00058 TaxID=1401066 RepID=A0A096D575_9BACT|nr:hypothetical protein [Prevotella amnii]KGF52689.1 hypothetical protein HMPREF9302_02875 [Prevotella amnii DNF00058]